eukprot:jgi/Botrbrau1/4912/Bobra.118_1s0025.1
MRPSGRGKQYIYKYQRTTIVLECGWRVWRASLQGHGAGDREFKSPRKTGEKNKPHPQIVG